MRIFHSSFEIKKPFKNPVVAIGNFDGVHLGHQKIFKHVIQEAQKKGGTSIVYTFHPHPSCVIHPETCEPQIHSLETRLKLIEEAGIDVTVVENFNREFSEKSAHQFFEEVILENLKTKVLFVGFNFFFGKARAGNTELLKTLCKSHGIEMHIMPPFKMEEEVVSSSKIRHFLKEGNIHKANEFLGRPFFLEGLTIKGVGRGHKLGIPTANLQTQAEIIPKEGVYITFAEYKGKKYKSVTNVGHAPTFKDEKPSSIETHLLDWDKDIYGESFRLHFLEWIREIKKFPSAETLVKQIQKDIQTAKDYFTRM